MSPRFFPCLSILTEGWFPRCSQVPSELSGAFSLPLIQTFNSECARASPFTVVQVALRTQECQAATILPHCNAPNTYILNIQSPVNLVSGRTAIIIKSQFILHILPRYCITVSKEKLVLKLKQIGNYFLL